jgi:serine/threonine protein kinase
MAEYDLSPGQMVGEYRVERKIGEGGFGVVYAAVHPVIGKPPPSRS